MGGLGELYTGKHPDDDTQQPSEDLEQSGTNDRQEFAGYHRFRMQADQHRIHQFGFFFNHHGLCGSIAVGQDQKIQEHNGKIRQYHLKYLQNRIPDQLIRPLLIFLNRDSGCIAALRIGTVSVSRHQPHDLTLIESGQQK